MRTVHLTSSCELTTLWTPACTVPCTWCDARRARDVSPLTRPRHSTARRSCRAVRSGVAREVSDVRLRMPGACVAWRRQAVVSCPVMDRGSSRVDAELSRAVSCRVSAPHGDRISDPPHRTSGRPADSVRSGRVGIRSRVCHRGRRACVVRALLDVELEAIGRTGDAPSMLCGLVAFASCRVVTRVCRTGAAAGHRDPRHDCSGFRTGPWRNDLLSYRLATFVAHALARSVVQTTSRWSQEAPSALDP